MTSRGFSLIELLIACALLLAVTGAVAAMAAPWRAALDRSRHSGQLEPAGRGALAALVADVREAGSDAGLAEAGQRLARFLPRLLPMRDLDDESVADPGGAIRVVRTPAQAAQANLRTAAAAGATVLQLWTASRCAGGPPACGFAPGELAVVYDGAAAEIVTIDGTGTDGVILAAPLANAFAAGAVVAEAASNTYGVRRAADGSGRLVRLTSRGAEQPMLDNVVSFEVALEPPDLVRAERAIVRLRIEAASDALRGPAGYLFQRAGTAGIARQWLPDVELRVAVALRNPGGHQ